MNNFPEGINIVDSVFHQEGVDTLEGRIGPLLLGESSQCHFIEMPANSFCAEHEHDTESIIFTAKGQWVLCSRGQRFHMKEGSLFWFGPNKPTGYEVPFDESAFIIIFKGERSSKDHAEMVDYLKGLRRRLIEEQKNGTSFSFPDLPDDHPAKHFASQLKSNVNP
jgi:quercetin dioxygenase-like cupin family protein